MVRDRIPEKFGLHPIHDVQVLTPMHYGILGTDKLNSVLKKALNKEDAETRLDTKFDFKVNGKIIQCKNNYSKEVFNGAMGNISSINEQAKNMVVSFNGRKITYTFNDTHEISLAYAISIHKSQGSEYQAVVIPITIHHYAILQRNLIYTAITRGSNLVIIIGVKKALQIGIKNSKFPERFTNLKTSIQKTSAP